VNQASTPRGRQLWLVPAEGRAGSHLVAEVAVKGPTARLHSYAVPEALKDIVRPGASLVVPFGRGQTRATGLCVRVTERPWDHSLRPVWSAQPGVPWLTGSLIELGLWVSEYYVCPPWKAFSVILPTAVRKPRVRTIRYVRVTGVHPTRPLTPKQSALLAAIGSRPRPCPEVLREARVSRSTLEALCKMGVLECQRQVEAVPESGIDLHRRSGSCPEDAFDLTTHQRQAYERIAAALDCPDPFRAFLLWGVPGSGKTEVYVRLMRAVISRGRQAILLVPEIALTTQLVERLSRRFDRVAVLHGQLPTRLRAETLAAVAEGRAEVVIGTRTAVFAPCPRLGLIIVDEEQESSFKNLAAPFYHARDVAVKRGQLERVPVVLGSATPSLESWYNAQHRRHYELVRMPERVPGAVPPAVHLVSATDDRPGCGGLISPQLRERIEQTLAGGGQAILLHNRRGYATYLRCRRCGLMLDCQRCGTHLVYHQAEQVLKCHRCGGRADRPARCLDDTCGGPLDRTGLAIQRLEQELRETFPQARWLRLDRDTMRRREDYQAALDGFESGQADILLGTQMVAKGLDFPGVRLVGVIDADAGLSLPDLRAAERVFQLLVQVVGRAGRRSGGSVALIQTAGPPTLVIRHALRMDYESFASEELKFRRQFFCPPIARMARLVLADPRPGRARQEAERLAEGLRARAGRVHAGLRVDPAEPCVVRQVRGMLRYQVMVRGPRGASLQDLVSQTLHDRTLLPRVRRFTIDVDPVDLL